MLIAQTILSIRLLILPENHWAVSPTGLCRQVTNHTFPIGNGGEIIAGAHTKLSDSHTIVLLGSANFYRQPSFTRTDATLYL